MNHHFLSFSLIGISLVTGTVSPLRGQTQNFESLSHLSSAPAKAQNALWIETPMTVRFNTSKTVVVADLKGPATITMIHFAMPQTLKLNRDLLLRAYWDGETNASVEVPLVDFFCDPAGLRDSVSTVLVNKRRGFNAYFPMPFRKSAKIELSYDGPVAPGEELWKIMPCYSYVMYHPEDTLAPDTGYFHASWRQEGLLLGKRDYLALEAQGKGKFVGWNVTVRSPGRPAYPVDENENFYVDGEQQPSIEFQGLEDSFGFSWGFPESESIFPLTGYFPFFQGAAAYRFFIQDAIPFQRSLRVTIGFGPNEHPMFRRDFSKPGSTLQFSSTAYWYQTEPHRPLPTFPAVADRAPAPEEPFWPEKEVLPNTGELASKGVKLYALCGRPTKEVFFAQSGYGLTVKKGYAWSGWSLPVYHARADNQSVQLELLVPPQRAGTLRIYCIDPDNFDGGRKQTVAVAGHRPVLLENFQEGKWIEEPFTSLETAGGTIPIRIDNAREGSNAVISIVEWIESSGSR